MKKILCVTLLAGAVCLQPECSLVWSSCEAGNVVQSGISGETEADNLLLVNKISKLPDDYEEKVDLVTVKNCFGKEFQVERET